MACNRRNNNLNNRNRQGRSNRNLSSCISPTNDDILDSCCDPYNGTQLFCANRRSCFWPTFAHPRWLSCRELYTGSCPVRLSDCNN